MDLKKGPNWAINRTNNNNNNNTVTTYLLKGKLLKCYKIITIIILQKANKKDYSLLKSYRLITFKNTLGKLLKKIVIECMQKATEV